MTAPDPLAVIEETLRAMSARSGSEGDMRDEALVALASLKREREAHERLRDRVRRSLVVIETWSAEVRAALDGERETGT